MPRLTFWRANAEGVTIVVKVQPRSRRAGLQGRAPTADGGETIKLGVTEAAEDGKANRAICRAIADLLGVPESAVDVMVGASTRSKVVRVTGDPARLGESLDRW